MNLRQGVLWDSSALLALLDANDADHKCAVAVAGQIASQRRPSFITNHIEVEAHALLLRKLGRILAREWLLTGGLPVIRALPAEENLAREIVARHSDKSWSLFETPSLSPLWMLAALTGRSRSIIISFNTAGSKYKGLLHKRGRGPNDLR